MCKEPNPSSFLDKRLKRSLSGFRVYCIHRAKGGGGKGEGEGCEWVGEFGELERHLNENPSADNQLNGCLFMEIKCKLCDELFKRVYLEDHQSNDCPKRKYVCLFCGYDSTYVDITERHFQECPSYPSQCRHCEKIFKRQDLGLHVDNECILAPISCDFQLVGCREQLPRAKMAGHINSNRVSHALLLVEYAKEHPDHTLGQYCSMLVSCVDTVSKLSSDNAALTVQTVAHRKELKCLQSLQLVLILTVFVLVLIVVVVCGRS